MGLTELKDVLWRAINDESNQIGSIDIIHRPLDGQHRVREEDEFIFENTPQDTDPAEDADMQRISAESWGDDFDYDDGYGPDFDTPEDDEEDPEERDDDIVRPDDPDAFLFESSLDNGK